MESALYGIFTLVGFVSEISLVCCAHSFDFRYFTNSCENPVRTRFPRSNLYILDIFPEVKKTQFKTNNRTIIINILLTTFTIK